MLFQKAAFCLYTFQVWQWQQLIQTIVPTKVLPSKIIPGKLFFFTISSDREVVVWLESRENIHSSQKWNRHYSSANAIFSHRELIVMRVKVCSHENLNLWPDFSLLWNSHFSHQWLVHLRTVIPKINWTELGNSLALRVKQVTVPGRGGQLEIL